MLPLNLPSYPAKIQKRNGKNVIFDALRQKYVALTPEEWVRQHVLHYFIYVKNYPKSYISIEKTVKINGQNKRYDLVLHNSTGSIHILVECKEPNVKITQETFDQIARYNGILNADYLMVTNGLNHYYCKLDYKNEVYHFLNDIP